jgi:ABC-type lipoprotein release transport system permease subunit
VTVSLLRLAWRNVTRQRRRAALTISATAFATFVVTLGGGVKDGTDAQVIEGNARLRSGHVALTGAGHRRDPTLAHTLVLDDALVRTVETTPGVRALAPRLAAPGLLSSAAHTAVVTLLGVDPAREARVSTLAARVRAGAFVPAAGGTVVVGQRLADALGVQAGDTVLAHAVAYTLEPAYERYRVSGVMRLPDPTLDATLAVLALADAQALLAREGRATEVAVLAAGAADAPAVAAALRTALAAAPGEPVEVRTWDEQSPELVRLLALNRAGGRLVHGIVLAVVGFGILDTLLISVVERRREFGVVLALGLRPGALFRLVVLESLCLGGLGVAVGLAAAVPAVAALGAWPVRFGGELARTMEVLGADALWVGRLEWRTVAGAAAAVGLVSAAAALYPARLGSRTPLGAGARRT